MPTPLFHPEHDRSPGLAPAGASPEPKPDPHPVRDDGPPCRWCVVEHLGCPCIEAVYIEPEGDGDGPW